MHRSHIYCWASSREGCRQLRHEGFQVKLHNRELYSRQLSNHHALDRIRQLEDFWKKLSSCACTFKQKIVLVQRVAWPRAFHAVSAVVVGRKHSEGLQTSRMQALRLQKPQEPTLSSNAALKATFLILWCLQRLKPCVTLVPCSIPSLPIKLCLVMATLSSIR